MSHARYLIGDTREVVASLPDNSVDLILTSPPFLALRSYLPADHPDKAREIGSEATPADFLDVLLDLTEEWARVLAPHGSIAVELGDTYAGSGGGGGDYNEGGRRDGQARFLGSNGQGKSQQDERNALRGAGGWPLDKSLCGIPHLFHLSLAYGRNLLRPERLTDPWRIRNVVAWCRPNPPVGALGDKYRPATSYMTIACKSRSRWFDLDSVREHNPRVDELPRQGKYAGQMRVRGGGDVSAQPGDPKPQNPAGAPPLDWWNIPTAPYAGAHYATFPPELCVRPIRSMCPLRVCRVCGEPQRRIVEAESFANGKPRTENLNGRSSIEPSRGASAANRKATGATFSRVVKSSEWSDCGHNDWRNGVCLDPFAGSGTTLAVATGHGRDAIGIDLDARNADLALERVGPMFLTVERHAGEAVA